MKLATRLTILSGSALLAILLSAGVFSWQTSRISDLYAQRFEARAAQNDVLAVDRDLHTLLATINRLLFVTDPARVTQLNTRLAELGAKIDVDLRRAADESQGRSTSRQYEPLVAAWENFKASYETELTNVRRSGDADAAEHLLQRPLAAAALVGMRAARVEGAAGGNGVEAGHGTVDLVQALAVLRHVGYGGHQTHRVRVGGVVDDLVYRADLGDAARIHHCDTVAGLGDHAHVVGHQHHPGP